MPRPDPPDARALWLVPPGQKVRPRLRHLVLVVLLLVPTTLTATLGTISFSKPDGTAIASFWPAVAFQIVFSIWFGVYGALAGVIGPMLGNGLVGESALLYIPGNAIQSCLAGLWFRYRKLDPRLRSRRDWAGLILVGILLANALGAVAGVTESNLREAAGGGGQIGAGLWGVRFVRWFAGNTVPCLLLAPAMLMAVSPMLVRSQSFCQRFWGGTDGGPGPTPRHRFSDMPVVAKLLALMLAAGILPLSVLAAWSVWDTMKTADRLAAARNHEAAREIRNDVERHELMLRMWAAELDRPDLSDAQRKALLKEWAAVPKAFNALEITDRARIEGKLSPELRRVFPAAPVVFYVVGDRRTGNLHGAARLKSMPDKVLTGSVVWRGDQPRTAQWAAVEAVVVLDRDGNELYRDGPVELRDWRVSEDDSYTAPDKIRHGERTWHVAEAELPRLGWRFVTLTSAKAGQAVTLANVPNTLAALINLSIFGSLIAGSAVARGISGRLLAMAECVRETGAEPGKLQIRVRGRDELGYLGDTLNRMSQDLAENVRRLQETTTEKERLAAEMELAREVQRGILPAHPPQVPGYEFAAASHPAREVGGDFFDFFLDADGRAVMMIGDAAGKGLKAAMFITETHGLAHAVALDRPTPERILSGVNQAMASERVTSSDFVTMLCAVLEPQQHRLLYASAGHHPPLLLHDGQTRSLELGSLPLAISDQADYELHQVGIAPGDAVILYTDGVTEASNPDDELFDVQRLEAVARRHAAGSASELLDAVLEAVWEFVADAPQSDDITLLVLRRCE